jgi:hypothetical protein
MTKKSSKWKGRIGVIYVLTGIGIGANALVSGPHAFGRGTSAVVGLCSVALILSATGGKMIFDSRH